MAIRIKNGKLVAEKRTIRHRGQRLIKTDGGVTRTYIQCRAGCCSRLIEVDGRGQNFKLTYSPTGTHAIAKGTDREGPVQYLVDAGGQLCGLRASDEDGWAFTHPEQPDLFLIAVDHAGIGNKALVAGAVCAELDRDLARWLGCSPLLCKLEDIMGMLENPRLKRVLHFDFDVAIAGPVPTGPRVEDHVRHHHSSWEEMLREAGRDVGGILFPKEYDALRTGVDRLVRVALKNAAGGTP